jgi:sugar phosphate isomerase/epimerase
MRSINPLEIGVMFWADNAKSPAETIREQQELGVNAGQLGIPGEYEINGKAAAWQQAADSAGFAIVTVVCAYTGESYADMPTVQRTVGFIPPATRAEREQRTLAASDFAAAIGVKSIGCHVGFVPEDESDPDYAAVRDLVRRISDRAAANGQTFALETGQEPADVLLRFLKDCGRANLKINFDPANMILYGTGDPIQALEVLAPNVVSVHCKDGNWPPQDVKTALGTEPALGQGAVGIPNFIAKLKQVGYQGILSVEREGASSKEERASDIRKAVAWLAQLRG